MRTAPTSSAETISDDIGPAQWLDALAEGTCSQDEFVERVLQRESADPEVTWEVLALLDQNFRRKRLDRETFVCLKARLHRHSLGVREDGGAAGTDAAPAIPPPLRADAAPAITSPLRTDAPPAIQPPLRADTAPTVTPTLRADAAPGPSLRMDTAPRGAPLPLPAMHALDEDAPAERELLEASFHHEIRGGDLLCGRYRIVDILRRREWMTLAEAVDEPKAGLPGIRQRVALQVLEESLSQDALLLQRIGKLQALSHPAITRVLDVEEDNGSLVLVTEFFGGISLRDLLERRTDRRVPIQSALGIVRTLASALAHAHARGVAHGDLTAGNVLITDLGEARLQGFELRAQSLAVQPAADRMAFARLAYELLAGTADPVTSLTTLSLSRLRAPPGVTRAQWRVMRDTLSGRDGSADTGILAAFGGEDAGVGDAMLLHDAGIQPPRRLRHLREWVAAGIVGAIIGSGIYLYLGVLPASDQRGEVATVAAVQVPANQRDTSSTDAPPGIATAPAPTTAPASASANATAPAPARISPGIVSPGNGSDARMSPTIARDPAVEAPPPAPRPAPIRPSIDLASTYAWVETTEPVARIWVTRRGSLNREVTFRWWTETGTAEVNRDFRAIEPRVGVIAEGSRGVELLVPLMPDPTRREPRTFYVKIDEPGPGADLGTRTLMQVAIVPPGYPAARDTRAAQNLALPVTPP